MKTYRDAIKNYFKNSKQVVVFAIYDGGDKYLFGVKDPNTKGEPLDPWYTIHKKNLTVKGFQPHEDWDFFQRALKNKVTTI